MIKQPRLYLLIFTLFYFIFGQLSFAQLSKTHYIPPLTNAEIGNANPESQYIYISTPSENEIPYTITPVGSSNNAITGKVSKSNPQDIYIGTGYSQLFVQSNQTSKVINNKGYIVEASGVIYVSVRMSAGSSDQAGALVSKGLSALGKEFRVGSYTNQNPQTNYLNFVSVMATEDNTKVNFSNLPADLVIKNYSGATPVKANLNKGESYIIATNSSFSNANKDGLIGCLVKSDKDIVVNCGSANGSFSNGGGRDYGIDQIVGAEKIGTEYIFVKGDGENEWENVLIVANYNNTEIYINGSTSVEATLNAGNYYLIEGDKYSTNGNMYVKTSEDVFAYQGIGATNSEANQGMFFVPPLSCSTRGNVDNIANIDKIGSITFTGGVTIISKKGATVTINNLPITNFSSPSDVPGNTEYVTYKATGLSGNVSVESDNELYCAYFNYNGSASSGSFYSGFPTAPEINFNTSFQTLGNCIGNITLEALNTQNFDSLEWFFNDGTGFVSKGNSTVLTPLDPGIYKLIGYISCTNLTFESFEVPISFCPADTDKDGIIDNIDIDNDNDGILNSIESKGDAKINLSNINSPSIVLNNEPEIKNFASGNFTITDNTNTTNSFTGDANGNFKSEISATINTINNYTINFSDSINFKFTENTAITHIINEGAYFVAKITPANKTITLIDPDNRLLVDTNFDEIYETGITQITGSEIRFKINPTPSGTTPFQFLANKVTGFSFIHQLTNINDPSIFNGIISLTDYANDNDNDGIEDALDLDSDNDGIPDIIENQGKEILLAAVDTDENGLDDVFDINSTPIDSDNDDVVDFYDLDSDNDGIFDLFESGSNLLDKNYDGIIDNVNATIGFNGWDNNAEKTPDSGEIGYTLNDLDSDGVFSYIDFDSDGDNCNDSIEAGFSDENNDNYLGNSTITVNNNGVVTNANNGYTLPNSNYNTFAEISIIDQPKNINSCIFTNSIFTINTNQIDLYQWQVSTDNGTRWQNITDNENYNGSNSNTLTIKNTPNSFNNYSFRVYMEKLGNSCGLYSNEATLTVNLLPNVKNSVELTQCDDDNDGFSFFNLNESKKLISENYNNENFEFYSDKEHLSLIKNPIAYKNPSVINSKVYVKISNTNNCESYSEITLKVSVTQIPSDFEILHFYSCEEYPANNQDGKTQFNFSDLQQKVLDSNPLFSLQEIQILFFENLEDALSETNSISDISNYRNTTPWVQKIYTRVDSDNMNACLGLNHVATLHTEKLPEFEVNSPQILCITTPQKPLILTPEIENLNTDLYQYFWHNSSGDLISNSFECNITEAGFYYITLTNKDGLLCSTTKEIEVKPSKMAVLTIFDIEIIDDNENNTIKINTDNLGIGDYEFSLDNTQSYTDEAYFEDVTAGIHTIYVNDKNGCAVQSIDISVIGFPKFFTPNNDGVNDTWKVIGANNYFYPTSNIYIFDRFGKVITSLTPDENGWDGTLNGKPLPATDYWFSVQLTDKYGNTRIKNGHFSLIRK
ncbi:T9SS type B sorting domain-containing protein [Lutibacter sp. A80]|uniref:T9SS type B sorting domain-containing protein n=1 Tax=Lutibacter sp. A80 TaxID=2918453 RepID=UPI001F05D25D|nr:T9SS type B sorting domain-containing protein [Lutibacter sp. A80]UMB61000.1 T9SS type B sorting domain-containing protein [Lutibacter sp. A80]